MTDNAQKPWEWSEEHWRKIVGIARGGRSLAPKAWPGGARCAVSLSFDADHETIPLRDSDESPMRISQGQYGNRQGVPRIRKLLDRHGVRASFFYPAVSALLHPDEVRAVSAEGHEIGIAADADSFNACGGGGLVRHHFAENVADHLAEIGVGHVTTPAPVRRPWRQRALPIPCLTDKAARSHRSCDSRRS